MANVVRKSKFERSVTVPAGGWSAGHISLWGGLFWILMGLQDLDEGDIAAVRSDQTVEVLKNTQTDVFVDGADVFYDVTAQNALTVGGDGTLGKCVGGSTAADTTVTVLMNPNGA